ncbi:MAG: hypothetical protein CR959_01375 [Fusobacteriales bacterium]|nr:MAG: hypothetical protein CR959_01375 [Fusobacteriales bacterium]
MESWTHSIDIINRLKKKWDNGDILRSVLEEDDTFYFKMKLRAPLTSELSVRIDEIIEWIQHLKNNDKVAKGYGYTLIEKEVKFRSIGRNSIPTHAVVENVEDALKLLKKFSDVRKFRSISNVFLNTWEGNERLFEWIRKYPFKLMDKIGDESDKFITVIRWFEEHSNHNMYIRQLDIPKVDTKFIEKNKSILGELFDIILPEENIDIDKKNFEDRFYLKKKPNMVRFRLLDSNDSNYKFSDMSVPLEEFANWNNDISTVFFTENEINFLSFPNIKNSLVIFGVGYKANILKEVKWLNNKIVYYWGDIDTHGFNILSMVRGFIPNVKSLLMTEDILMSYKHLWVREDKKYMSFIKNLTKEESDLVIKLQNDDLGINVRLEQERVGFHKVSDSLKILDVRYE